MINDSIRFIFRTLIKIPITIAVCYLIGNLAYFAFFYYKFLGISNEVAQIAMENNYIPPTEKAVIERSLREIENSSGLITDTYICVGENMDIDRYTYMNNRTQYGSTKTVGVHFKYKWFWPLMPEDYGMTPTSDSDLGISTMASSDAPSGNLLVDGKANYSDDQLDSMRESKASTIPINLYTTVPGLQYYADLD